MRGALFPGGLSGDVDNYILVFDLVQLCLQASNGIYDPCKVSLSVLEQINTKENVGAAP